MITEKEVLDFIACKAADIVCEHDASIIYLSARCMILGSSSVDKSWDLSIDTMSIQFSGRTLQEAVNKAVFSRSPAAMRQRAEQLRREADELEKQASASLVAK